MQVEHFHSCAEYYIFFHSLKTLINFVNDVLLINFVLMLFSFAE